MANLSKTAAPKNGKVRETKRGTGDELHQHASDDGARLSKKRRNCMKG